MKLPETIQEAMGIGPGSEIEFQRDERGNVLLVATGRKKSPPTSVFQALRGSAGPGLTTDEIMLLTRGDG